MVNPWRRQARKAQTTPCSHKILQAVNFLQHRADVRKRVVGVTTAEKDAAQRLINLQGKVLFQKNNSATQCTAFLELAQLHPRLTVCGWFCNYICISVSVYIYKMRGALTQTKMRCEYYCHFSNTITRDGNHDSVPMIERIPVSTIFSSHELNIKYWPQPQLERAGGQDRGKEGGGRERESIVFTDSSGQRSGQQGDQRG